MLTGGYLPLAATLTTQRIYDAFLGTYKDMKHFFHGHTFTGNPISTSVALTNLNLYKKNGLISKIQKRSKQLKKIIPELFKNELVGDVRHKGMLMGIELVKDKKTKKPIDPVKQIQNRIFVEGKKHQIYLRTLGHIVMLVPPLAISKNELDFLIDGTIKTIKNVSNQI